MHGIEVVYPCERPVVDLVFVHGVRGDSRKTWTSSKLNSTAPEKPLISRSARFSRVFKKRASQSSSSVSPKVTKSEASSETSKVFWPRDLLGPDLQNVRILTYGYDARIPTLLNRAADGSIFTISQDLVTRLELSRQSDEMENVPIIFAAHSLGGLVVKDALKFSQDQDGFQQHLHSIFANSYGVMFFGTPHRGSGIASLGLIAARIAGLGMAESELHLLRSLEQDSTELKRIADSFSRMLPQQAKGLNVYTFQEGLPLTGFNFAGKVVEDWSSIIGDAYEGMSVLQANHMEMCRFSGVDEPDYILVSGIIKRWVREAQKGKQRVLVVPPAQSTVPRVEYRNRVDDSPALKGFEPELPITLDSTGSPPSKLPQVPSRNFVGRTKELDQITQAFKTQRLSQAPQNITVIYGMGGIGKTQLALTFANQQRQKYTALFWINARSDQTILLGYLQIAQTLVDWTGENRGSAVNFTRIGFELGLGQAVSPATGEVISPSPDSRIIADAMKSWLQRPGNEGWLLVFDSADDLEGIDLQNFLPQSDKGDILITSRRFQASQLGIGIRLRTMEPSVAREVLIKTAQGDRDQDILSDYDDVAKALGNLPLALAQAGSYMAATQTKPAVYFRQYKAQKQILLDKKPPKALSQYEESVLSTWEISFASIDKRSPSTARLLLLCGYLQPENIPYLFLELGVIVEGRRAEVWQTLGPASTSFSKRLSKRILNKLSRNNQPSVLTGSPWLQELFDPPSRFQESIHLLLDYSLITENEDSDGFILHPLVHSWCAHREMPDRVGLAVESLCLAGRAVDWDHEQLKAWVTLRRFNPHLIVCATSFLQLDLSSIRFDKKTLDIPQAIESIGYALYNADHAGEACKLFQLNSELSENTLGKSHPLTFATTDYLASALEASGKLYEAEVVRKKLVEDSRRALGDNSDDVFTYRHNLGKLLVVQEKYSDAEPILKKVLKFRQKHSTLVSTIAPAVNLGVVYMELHQFKAAETMLTAAKELMNNETDKNLSLRLQTMGWLGYLKSELGRRDECEALTIEAVELAKFRCGLEDPLTLLWHKHLLDFYAEDITMMDEERRELMVSVGKYLISTWSNIKGSSDRNRCKIQICLGNLFYALGDFNVSKDYYQGVLTTVSHQDSTEMSIGDQGFMAQANGGLGMCHWDRGLVAQAIQYWTVAHELYGILAQERQINIQDFHDTKSNIAIGLRDSHEYHAAEALLKEVLAAESTLPNQATSLLTKNNLATIYHLQARHSEALEIFQNSLAAVPPQDEQLPRVLLLKHSLACLHESMGNLGEAISLLESTLSFKELKLGIRSPATLKTAVTLARMYRKREDDVKAMELADRIRPYLGYA